MSFVEREKRFIFLVQSSSRFKRIVGKKRFPIESAIEAEVADDKQRVDPHEKIGIDRRASNRV